MRKSQSPSRRYGRTKYVVVAIVAGLFVTMTGCVLAMLMSTMPLTGTVQAANFFVAGFETRTYEGDVTIVASESATIDGTLSPASDTGCSITIECDGEVMINGTIMAGNGSNTQSTTAKRNNHQDREGLDGGDVVIESTNGDIIIGETATIRAGDGVDGVLDSDGYSGGAGGDGGSVILRAPNGTISLPAAPGAIHLGNGGTGAGIVGEFDPNTAIPVTLVNAGGNSGLPQFDALMIDGIEPEEITLEEDLIDPVTGEVLAEAGETITLIRFDPDTGPLTGGSGGDAGEFEVNWAESQEQGTAKRDGRSSSAFEGSEEKVGNPGGMDFSPVDQARASERRDGKVPHREPRAKMPKPPGEKEVVVMSSVWQPSTCSFPALAFRVVVAWATASGGRGADGPDPSGDGGDGGAAEATGGECGIALSHSDNATQGGDSGSASAYGGKGGSGGNACPTGDRIGGNGGRGGDATAIGYTFSRCAPKFGPDASGGEGGNAGNGTAVTGVAGFGGDAHAMGERGKQEDGLRGDSARLCPPSDPDPDPNDPNTTPDPNQPTGDDGWETLASETKTPLNDVLDPGCNPNDGGIHITSLDFVIPTDATKVRITVTGSSVDSRINMLAKAGNQTADSCGTTPTSNSTVIEFTPTEFGNWYVSISERAVVSTEYGIKVEIQR